MAERKKIRLELSDSDWGRVAVAVRHELNGAMNDWHQLSGQRNLKHGVPLCVRIDALNRIHESIRDQRRAIRYGQVTDQSVSKCKNGHVGPMTAARRQTTDKRSWIDGEWCRSCQTYVFPSQDVAA